MFGIDSIILLFILPVFYAVLHTCFMVQPFYIQPCNFAILCIVSPNLKVDIDIVIEFLLLTCGAIRLRYDIDGLLQERRKSIAYAWELRLSCINHRYV